jgi:TRAP-type mannitol/chloroaromatic compound transport system substrate-binding protein
MDISNLKSEIQQHLNLFSKKLQEIQENQKILRNNQEIILKAIQKLESELFIEEEQEEQQEEQPKEAKNDKPVP